MYYKTDQIRTELNQMQEYPQVLQNRSNTGQNLSDTGVPVGTAEQIRCRTELIQIRDLSNTGVPIGTAEQIKCRTELIQIQNLSGARVPVGTTGLIQIRKYP